MISVILAEDGYSQLNLYCDVIVRFLASPANSRPFFLLIWHLFFSERSFSDFVYNIHKALKSMTDKSTALVEDSLVPHDF